MAASNNSFQGRLALVTGGSSGIGLALAQLLAREGAAVWLLARHTDRLESAVKTLAAENGQKHGILAADVTNWDQVQAAVQRVSADAAVPDILVNCAGAAHPGYVQEMPLEVFHDMMDLDYFGTVQMVKALLPAMLKRGSGYVVNFSSAAGFLGTFGYSSYGPAKYAVRGFSDVLRLELKPLGVRVSVVFPPDTDTPGMVNENKTKPWETIAAFSTKLASAESVAKGILAGMKRGRYIILPGFEVSLYYRLVFLLGNAIYPIMDGVLAQARSKKKKS